MQSKNLHIKNCNSEDISEIFRLYRIAADYQRMINAVVIWPEFERELVETELAENRQWKLLVNGEIACVWVTTYSDEQIWEERNADTAVYIHRIATNPDHRGHNFVKTIVGWAIEHARTNGKEYVRLDTLGENHRLIEHYTKAGFTFLGMFDLKDTSALPVHYHGVPACLFELKI